MFIRYTFLATMAVSIVLSTLSSSASMLECAIGKRVDFNAMNSHSSGRSPKIKFDSTKLFRLLICQKI